MSEDVKLVVIGAGLAGLRACEAARRAGHHGPLVLLGEETHLPYDRPPLSKEFLAAEGANVGDPLLRPATMIYDELDIDVRTGTRAVGLDTIEKTVAVESGYPPQVDHVSYDELVVATGATARTLPGAEDLTGVLALRTLDDAHAVRVGLDAGANIVVVGAGFIGSEVASAARKRGLPVTIVEALDAPLVRSLGVEVGALCSRLHLENGADLRLGVGVAALTPLAGSVPDDAGRRPVGTVELSDGSSLAADLVVVGVGAAPSTAWLRGSGVKLHERDGGIVCDGTMGVLRDDGSRVEHVWAAGDVAHWDNPLFDRTMRLEHWTSAAEQGATAARNALTTPDQWKQYTTVPYFWSDWYDTRLQFVGVPQADEILVQHRTDNKGGTVVLYREEDRLVGTLTIGRPDLVMKYRRLIAQKARWFDGVQFGAAAS
ncbi:FAD-dependent oxidoreductase [Rhodococcus opacus]|nr:FAD-dependent oxidoreductase [Rhodococcus opacus]RKM64834.1 FAD-dependent oxidoreductase [Rhodococcus opacus]